MRTLFLAMLSLAFCSILIGQSNSDEPSGRKGQWIIEVGNGIFSNLVGSASGGSILFSDGSTLTNFGINAGKFISDDFAVKFNLGVLSIGTGFGSGEVYTIMGGGKYYIGGVAPIEASAGVLTGEGNTEFIGRSTIGYAISLADNINLEPAGGILFSDSDVSGVIQLSFAMFF